MNTESIIELIQTYEEEAIAAGDNEESELLLQIGLAARNLLHYINVREIKRELKNKRLTHLKL